MPLTPDLTDAQRAAAPNPLVKDPSYGYALWCPECGHRTGIVEAALRHIATTGHPAPEENGRPPPEIMERVRSEALAFLRAEIAGLRAALGAADAPAPPKSIAQQIADDLKAGTFAGRPDAPGEAVVWREVKHRGSKRSHEAEDGGVSLTARKPHPNDPHWWWSASGTAPTLDAAKAAALAAARGSK